MDLNNLMNRNQIGFRKNSRTSDHIFVLRVLFDKYIRQKSGKLYICFIDFEKAYDRVWRVGLLYKLQCTGVKGMFYKYIKGNV